MLLTQILFGFIFASLSVAAFEWNPTEENGLTRYWTKAGVRFRVRSVILSDSPQSPATSTYLIQTMPQQRNNKRAFLNSWSYRGCSNGEDLPPVISPFSYQLDPSQVSGASCQAVCDHRGDDFAATEDGNVCWCGKKEDANLIFLDNSECNVPCAAELGEFCGGRGRLSVYIKAT